MINRDEISKNINVLLRGYVDDKTEVGILVKNDREVDVYLNGIKFNTYLVEKNCFLHKIPKEMKKQEAFSISIIISRPDLKEKFRMYKGAELQLPATENEIRDAFQRARITKRSQPYMIEQCVIYNEDIHQILQKEWKPLRRLNYMAKVLSRFTNYEHSLFRGLMKVFADKGLSIMQLINCAYNVENCLIIDGIETDEQVGKLYVDNDKLEWIDSADRHLWKYIDYKALGKEIREAESAIFVDEGFFIFNKKSYRKVYDGKEFPEHFSDDEYVFRMQLAHKSQSNENAAEHKCWMSLPIMPKRKIELLKSIGAVTIEDCTLLAVQSMDEQIPRCIKDLSQFDELNDLAMRISSMQFSKDAPKFKAMMLAVNIECLGDVQRLMDDMNRYKLYPEPSSIIEYAKEQFKNEFEYKLLEAVIKHFNFVTYSESLPNKENLRVTEYGILEVPDTDKENTIQREENTL